MNVVMTGGGGFIEVQGTAEGAPSRRDELDALLGLAERGIARAGRARSATALGDLASRCSQARPRLQQSRQAARVRARCSRRSASKWCRSRAFGVAEAEEPHAPSSRTRLAKARHAARLTGLPALADDSGLCVDGAGRRARRALRALRRQGRRPRIARRAQQRQAARRARRPAADRRAHYYCVLVLVRHADDPQPLIAEGDGTARSSTAPRGDRRLRLRPAVLRAVDGLFLGGADAGGQERHQPPRPRLRQARRAPARGALMPRARIIPIAPEAAAAPAGLAACRRSRSTCISRGACASAPTATSTRTRRARAMPEARLPRRADRRPGADAAAGLGPAGHQRLHRRRHAEPARARIDRRPARRRARAADFAARRRNHAGSQSRHGRGRPLRRLPRRRA